MKSVTVPKSQLVSIINKNRSNHRTVFLEAQEKYRARLVEELDKRLKAAREGRTVDHYIQLEAPQDHSRDYDRILKMLDMHEQASIEISQEDFARYVMDDWQWKRAWVSNALGYYGAAELSEMGSAGTKILAGMIHENGETGEE